MLIYIILCAIVGILSFILLATKTKKADDVVYGNLDKAGKVTNIVFGISYIALAPLYIFIGLISYPNCEGFLMIIGWVISILNASTILFCGLGLGLSVAFRKKGKSKLSFIIQFLGFLAITFTIASYCVFVGNLLQPLI